jgi:hypothetical protein
MTKKASMVKDSPTVSIRELRTVDGVDEIQKQQLTHKREQLGRDLLI